MTQKQILLVLGGTWHDFDGFTITMVPIFETAGYGVHATYDLDALTRLENEAYDVVLLYTCLGGTNKDGTASETPTEAQAAGLIKWVRDGGGVLAAHAATVAGQSNPALKALMGAVFESHPPQFSFTVYPTYMRHPITESIQAFTVHDEFYIQTYDDTVDIHMVALDRGIVHPMVWSKDEGLGRVAHIAMGHDEKVWRLIPYQKLMIQALNWLTD